MSVKEANILRLMKNHADGVITLMGISSLLRISYRQVKRIWKNYRKLGETGLISKKRGNSNRALNDTIETEVLKLVKEKYYDYGPTLLTEKLNEEHGIVISRETTRKILINNGLRQSKKKGKVRVYQRRQRKSSFGELVQLDGSPHAWFEDRAKKCTLLLMIDDATGNLQSARFEYTETTEGYFRLLHDYILLHKKPNCLYSDKYGVFRVNAGKDRSKPTQFGRALKELDIGLITAHSPQAKGRVERANGVLQDRLVKELREKEISTMDEANLFLPKYLEKYNRKFGVIPASPFNAHREITETVDLHQILCIKEQRKISKNLEVRYKKNTYQIQAPDRVNRLRGVGVNVTEKTDGTVLIEYMGEYLDYVKYQEFEDQPEVLDHKELSMFWEKSRGSKGFKHSKYHPWKGGSTQSTPTLL